MVIHPPPSDTEREKRTEGQKDRQRLIDRWTDKQTENERMDSQMNG